ncbi:hypothetical protein LWI28_022596 [Acer negundo]|uniref:Uncharacterized protein n=1 Tax=Acer negundo TaxID=4023 RepID=A0AAD5JGZ9_ACENE|nr:hypothetical protein LWI28_022596 [Acer negundo]
MVWIEEDAVQKGRLDKGRILALIPLQNHIDCEVKVMVGHQSFFVKLKEHPALVPIPWVVKNEFSAYDGYQPQSDRLVEKVGVGVVMGTRKLTNKRSLSEVGKGRMDGISPSRFHGRKGMKGGKVKVPWTNEKVVGFKNRKQN